MPRSLRRPSLLPAAALLLSLASLPVSFQLAHAQSDESTSEAAPAQPATALAQFTTAVENREPIDQVSFVSTDVQKIYFFSDLRGLAGQTVIHRWIHGGQTHAEVPFEVRGPRWRVWSSKELLPDWIGDWTVEIVDGSGEVIAAETFTYTAPDA